MSKIHALRSSYFDHIYGNATKLLQDDDMGVHNNVNMITACALFEVEDTVMLLAFSVV